MIRTHQEEYVSAIFDSPDSTRIIIHTLVQLLQKLQLPVGDNLAGSSFLTGESPLADIVPRASSEELAAVEETLREDESPAIGEEPAGFPKDRESVCAGSQFIFLSSVRRLCQPFASGSETIPLQL